MNNDILFVEFDRCPISRQEAQDIVDSLFRSSRRFTLYGRMKKGKEAKTRGLHIRSIDGVHEIYLNPKLIEECVKGKVACGGNLVSPNVRLAFGMVLAHELQHANQTITHAEGERAFVGGKYSARACEREAREFADTNVQIIAGILGVNLKKEQVVQAAPTGELDDVIDSFRGVDDVSVQDIVEELRQSGLNTATNVLKVRKELGI